MKIILILFLLYTTPVKKEVIHMRQLYAIAALDEKKAEQLMYETESEKEDVLIMAYHGAAKMIMAKFINNPVSKWNSFKKGKTILESAIHAEGLNPELRFLRLTIQDNIPSFLGYKNNIQEDRIFLQKTVSVLEDENLKSMIMDYLKTE